MPDIAELKRILEIIEDDKKKPTGTSWDQGYWFRSFERWDILNQEDVNTTCGTAMCFAGWKVYLDGHTKFVPAARDEYGDYHDSRMVNPTTGKAVTYAEARDYAMKALGLTEEQADLLFSEDNELYDLERVIRNIEVDSKIDQQELAFQ